ncbi:3-hydroxyacyl-ACP dehydratase FabZ family protein [Streptomyces sedi]|uniref:ApeI dehydratase-like domain-containing protein n=1 Tax=Streptomyces sedi TaxID=555059 RepID=A0A5C4V8N4_9ACTN|nr:hypothetical protein [Streptomyces sedi]TNM32187.1 hypothetical protein FH715_07240 [Streptomyces sedi]
MVTTDAATAPAAGTVPYAGPVAGPVRVLARETDGEGGTARAALTVAAGEPVLPGHYPGFPIFPGVCLVECVRLAAEATAPAPLAPADGGPTGMAEIESTRFTGPVFPGDEVTITLDWRRKAAGWQCRAALSGPRGEAAKVRLRFEAPAGERPGTDARSPGGEKSPNGEEGTA